MKLNLTPCDNMGKSGEYVTRKNNPLTICKYHIIAVMCDFRIRCSLPGTEGNKTMWNSMI